VRTRLALAVVVLGALPAHGFQLEQLTCAPAACGIWTAQLTGDGRRIVFSSTCDLVPGANPDGIGQVFLLGVRQPRHRSHG
jgi:hypothetical protein